MSLIPTQPSPLSMAASSLDVSTQPVASPSKTMCGFGIRAVGVDNVVLLGQVAAIFRRYTKIALPQMPIFEYLRFGAFTAAPGAAHGIYKSVQELRNNAPEKADNVLNIIDHTGTLMDMAALLADGIDALGVASAAGSVDPLYITGAVLSCAGLVLHSKNIYETHVVQGDLNNAMLTTSQKEDNVAKGLVRAVKVIKDKQKSNCKFVRKYFDVESAKLTSRLDEISRYAVRKLDSPLPHKVEEGKKDVERTKNLLNKKLTTKKWSHAFSILTAVISLIGFGIIFSPAAPVGVALIGLAGIFGLAHSYILKRVNKSFEKSLKAIGT